MSVQDQEINLSLHQVQGLKNRILFYSVFLIYLRPNKKIGMVPVTPSKK
jgi:hypothetical protein